MLKNKRKCGKIKEKDCQWLEINTSITDRIIKKKTKKHLKPILKYIRLHLQASV